MLEACLDFQAIANAPFRQDIAWARRVRFELASQHPYRHPQVRYPINGALAPDGTKDLLVRNYPAGAFSKDSQYFVRFHWQLNLLST